MMNCSAEYKFGKIYIYFQSLVSKTYYFLDPWAMNSSSLLQKILCRTKVHNFLVSLINQTGLCEINIIEKDMISNLLQ